MSIRRVVLILVAILATFAVGNAQNQPVIPTAAEVQSNFTHPSWVILDRTTMEYAFGRTVAKRCLGVQVTIQNTSATNDLIVRDITLKTDDSGDLHLASLDKTVLQALSERGQSTDPRNVWLRSFRSAGVLAATVTAYAHVGPAFSPVVAAFNGSFIEAYSGLFPDYTVNQIVRLTNSAFEGNKVVTKSTSVNVVAFIPLKEVLGEEGVKKYKHNLHALVKGLVVTVDGSYVMPIAASPPGATASGGS